MENSFINDEIAEDELEKAIGGVTYEQGIEKLKEMKSELIQNRIKQEENQETELTEEQLEEITAGFKKSY